MKVEYEDVPATQQSLVASGGGDTGLGSVSVADVAGSGGTKNPLGSPWPVSGSAQLQIVPPGPKYCIFDKDGLCALHGTYAKDHSEFIGKRELMTREEVLARYPNAKLPK